MPKHVARYTITTGLSGCYMPDSQSGPVQCDTRAQLAALIREEIAAQGWPRSLFADVKIRRLWGFIRRNGSSVAHFSLQHDGREIAFRGLTEDEFRQVEEGGS